MRHAAGESMLARPGVPDGCTQARSEASQLEARAETKETHSRKRNCKHESARLALDSVRRGLKQQ